MQNTAPCEKKSITQLGSEEITIREVFSLKKTSKQRGLILKNPPSLIKSFSVFPPRCLGTQSLSQFNTLEEYTLLKTTPSIYRHGHGYKFQNDFLSRLSQKPRVPVFSSFPECKQPSIFWNHLNILVDQDRYLLQIYPV